ncbi:hypothetical protein [Marinobacter mobilis]|uniref:hypothetical protein n=1 Tax=Marinobacter mobilis TaxID=488533 RepID=UPI001587C19D|nr:hypothetical protein [Marinobacter mobilis]
MDLALAAMPFGRITGVVVAVVFHGVEYGPVSGWEDNGGDPEIGALRSSSQKVISGSTGCEAKFASDAQV